MSTLRRLTVPIGAVASVLLFLLVNPWFPLESGSTADRIVTVAFWISFIVLLVALFELRKEPGGETIEVEEPAFTRFLFSNSRAGLFWLPIRLFVGFTWLEAGYHKLSGTGWLDGGSSLAGFWKGAVAIPAAGAGSPKIAFDWYRDFLNILLTNHVEKWFSWLIVFGEIAVGVGLIVGAVVGVAAFFGALMNMSFMLAGSASTNPVLFLLAVALLLGRRVSGYYGLDRYVNEFLEARALKPRTPTTHVGQPMAA